MQSTVQDYDNRVNFFQNPQNRHPKLTHKVKIWGVSLASLKCETPLKSLWHTSTLKGNKNMR